MLSQAGAKGGNICKQLKDDTCFYLILLLKYHIEIHERTVLKKADNKDMQSKSWFSPTRPPCQI